MAKTDRSRTKLPLVARTEGSRGKLDRLSSAPRLSESLCLRRQRSSPVSDGRYLISFLLFSPHRSPNEIIETIAMQQIFVQVAGQPSRTNCARGAAIREPAPQTLGSLGQPQTPSAPRAFSKPSPSSIPVHGILAQESITQTHLFSVQQFPLPGKKTDSHYLGPKSSAIDILNMVTAF